MIERSRTSSASLSVPNGALCGVTGSDPKADLHRYLQVAREALLWKLSSISASRAASVRARNLAPTRMALGDSHPEQQILRAHFVVEVSSAIPSTAP